MRQSHCLGLGKWFLGRVSGAGVADAACQLASETCIRVPAAIKAMHSERDVGRHVNCHFLSHRMLFWWHGSCGNGQQALALTEKATAATIGVVLHPSFYQQQGMPPMAVDRFSFPRPWIAISDMS